MMISDKGKEKISKLDASLNKRVGWEQNNLNSYIAVLQQKGSVEVGWRECCGTTHVTMHIHGAWKKVIALLKKEGLQIQEERMKHGNRYATNNGGFWASIVYTLAQPGATQKAGD